MTWIKARIENFWLKHTSNPANSGPKWNPWSSPGPQQAPNRILPLSGASQSQQTLRLAVLRESPNDLDGSLTDTPNSSRLHPLKSSKGIWSKNYTEFKRSFYTGVCPVQTPAVHVGVNMLEQMCHECCSPRFFTLFSKFSKWVTTVIKYMLSDFSAKLQFCFSYLLVLLRLSAVKFKLSAVGPLGINF